MKLTLIGWPEKWRRVIREAQRRGRNVSIGDGAAVIRCGSGEWGSVPGVTLFPDGSAIRNDIPRRIAVPLRREEEVREALAMGKEWRKGKVQKSKSKSKSESKK